MTYLHTFGPKFFFLAFAAFFAFSLVKGFRTGIMPLAYGITVNRKEAPDGFRIAATFLAFFALCSLIGAALV